MPRKFNSLSHFKKMLV